MRAVNSRLIAAMSCTLLLVACSSAGGEGGEATEAATAAAEEGATAAEGAGEESAAPAAEEIDYPTDTLNIVVAFSAGGVNDTMSRLLAELLQENDLYSEDIVVENLEGGSGARGWGELFSHEGDPYYMSTTSGSFIATPLQADTPWTPTDFTPIALVATDEAALFVPGDAPYDTLEEFIAAAKEDPPTIAGVGAAQLDFIAPTLVADQAGFEFEYVAHDGTPEAINSLLSGSTDALVRAPGPVLGLLESGDVKALALSGSEPLAALPDVPLFEDLGYDITVSQPRAIVMPPGIEQPIVDFWIDAVEQVVEMPEWTAYLDENAQTENVLYGEDVTAYLEEVSANYEAVLTEAGVIQ